MNSAADRALAELAARQRGVFTFDDAVRAGLTLREASHRAQFRWQRLHDGVFRIPGAPETWESGLLAACWAVRTPPAAVSHWAAAQILGLPGGRDDRVEITCRRWKRTQTKGVVVHESTRFSDIDVCVTDGIPVTTAERCIVDLAGQRPSVPFVERLVQAARRKRMISRASLADTFARLRRRGLNGARVLAQVLAEWDPASRPTGSEMETTLLQILRDSGIEVVVQFEVLDEFGDLVATTDLAVPHLRICIEYDSMQEHLDEFQIARDNRRRNAILAAGYSPLVARYGDVRQGATQLIDEIERIARRSAAS